MRARIQSGFAILVVFSVVISTGCSPEIRESNDAAVRTVLPNGVLSVHYNNLQDSTPIRIGADLTIGVLEGESEYMFGSILGLEVDSHGMIYVFDSQANEIRAFDESGKFVRVVASGGEGPGEISRSNGMTMVHDSILWVQDYGRWKMLGISPLGGELAIEPVLIRSRAYIYRGSVDNQGKFWKSASVSDKEPSYPPPAGVNAGSARGYAVSYDPVTEAIDSVFIGSVKYMSYVTITGNGYSSGGIPYRPRSTVLNDPNGGFWLGESHSYTVHRLDEQADTTLTLTVDVPSIPLRDVDRRRFVKGYTERLPEQVETAEAIADLMPETKPLLVGLLLDDSGRFWVHRTALNDPNVTADDPIPPNLTYDVFDHNAHYLGSVILGFTPETFFPIRIRGNRIYAVSTDTDGAPVVIRSEPFSLELE